MDQLKSLSVLTFFLFVLLLASHPISSFFSRADFDPKIAQDKHGSDRTMPQPPSTRFHVPAALRQGLDPTFPAPIGQSPVCRSSLVKPRYWVDGRKHESTVPAFEAVLERLTDQDQGRLRMPLLLCLLQRLATRVSRNPYLPHRSNMQGS
jgi:hypothetical protein